MCVMRGMRVMRKRRPGRAILCGMRSERSCFEMMSVMTGLMTGLVGAGVVAGGLGGCSIVREATNFEPPAMEVVSVRVEPAESAGNGLSVVRFEVLAPQLAALPASLPALPPLMPRAAEPAITPDQVPVQLPPPSLLAIGRGFGHGVGMSQWGAHGMANRGQSYEQILHHYYRGTELRPYVSP